MNKQEIFAIVVQHSLEVLPELEGHDFQPSESLRDLGANSIDRAEISTLAMETLALKIPRVELSGVRTIGELVDVLYAKQQAV